MLDLFGLGNIGTTIALVLGALAALWGAIWKAKRDGAKDANAKRDAQNAAEYIAERKRQDEIDVGNDASDADRIGMLEAIRDRKRTGKN
jgi:hypothetical protein